MARKKSQDELEAQIRRIVDKARENPSEQNGTRLRKAYNALHRYINNISKTKSRMNYNQEWMKAMRDNNDTKAQEIMNKAGSVQYARSTYMGLSNT